MKTLFNICIIFCLSYPMGCSTTEDQKDPIPEVSPLIGDWGAINWYCTNEQNCSQDPYYVDLDASVTFTVTSVEGVLSGEVMTGTVRATWDNIAADYIMTSDVMIIKR